MKNILSMSVKFYQKNGLLGGCLSSICQLRGGKDSLKIAYSELKDSSGTSPSSKHIDDILNDDEISETYKKPFRGLREDPMFGDSEELQQARLRKNLIAKTKHPIYSKIKSKVPYALLTPFTFAELSRLASYRLAGFASAPLTIGGFIGFSMPCAVTFSMLEMYAPDRFKFPCKCAKWAGGIVFYGVCSSVDYLTAGLENKCFGKELPIDAPQLMGTLPKMDDLNELKKLKRLADSIMEKSPVLDKN
jgi:hypothetical protein